MGAVAASTGVIAPKGFRDGTDRLVSPGETLRRIEPTLRRMGITRLANVTGLDVIGVPVVMACRPNSRGLAVSQGKGLTLDAALASAAMESIESYHAELVFQPLLLGSYDDLHTGRRLIDPARLQTNSGAAGPRELPLLWIEGRELVSDEPAWVPFDLVHTDMTLSSRSGAPVFALSSSGLASGNHPMEAISHAICELIERDGTGLWSQRPPPDRAARRLDLTSVDDPGCRQVLDRLATAGVATTAWDLTTDVGLPSFRAEIAEDPDHAFLPMYAAAGYGCHPRREIALLRALTEAVQSRLTEIAGSRDDLDRASYRHHTHPNTIRKVWAERREGVGLRPMDEVPTFTNESFDADLALELDRLRAVGIDEVVVVDLTKPEFGIPVTRAVIPGLEPYMKLERYHPGPRARRIAQAAR
jgi:YcaO-like protein with predicted kinase domain